MFEGIDSLDYSTRRQGGNQIFDINYMVSADGEQVKIDTIQVEAKVENWLRKLIIYMQEALKRRCYDFYQQNPPGNKKEYEKDKLHKLIKDYEGQVLITMAQIKWTLEVTAALVAL